MVNCVQISLVREKILKEHSQFATPTMAKDGLSVIL